MTLKNIMPPRGPVLKVIYSVLLLLLFENYCSGGQWTMMFYMAADNDLYSQAVTDIEELRKISGQTGVDILVQLDSPSGAFRYKALPQGISILASLGQSNSGSPEALTDFGRWAVKTYPAQKYLLVLWDHGSGWSKNSKYIGYDQQFNDFLSVSEGELKEALETISAAAGRPLDILVFDACSMQMAEVLSELNGLCRYAIGSEALFPVEGMPYDVAWQDINGNTPAESLAARLVNSCSVFTNLGYQVTCSAVDIDILSTAAQNLKSLIGRLRQLPVSAYVSPAAVSDSILGFTPYDSYDLSQALDYIGNRVPDPEKTLVLDASLQFRNSILAQSIIGSQYQSAQGLAVWYPDGRMNFESGIESYPGLNWSGLSGWDKLLYQLIFQQDSTAPVPQNIYLAQEAGGVRKLTWENDYDPSGIEMYQVRHCQNLITDFIDRGGRADSSNWEKAGFTIIPRADGDTAYYSIGGKMTGKNKIPFDSSGSIGFSAEGILGSIVLESSGDTASGWDTLGVWNRFGDSSKKFYSAKVKSTTALVRFSWKPFSGGYWVFIDNIKVCHPDPTKEIETVNTSLLFYNLTSQPGAAGFYQIRTIDSLQNQSSWSDGRFYYPVAGDIRAWPNPFKDKVSLFYSSSTGRMQDVKVFNILGQYIDKMSVEKKEINGGMTEIIYYWEPKESLAEGMYFAQINSDMGVRVVKMILIR
jgi:hypothetical protein